MKQLIAFLVLATAAISMLAQSDCTLQYDGNGDGIVNSTDVLGLLSEFGASCIDTTTNTVEFQNCGDPISYQGYDYATVLIGEQCWFAENLRNLNYQNGDTIPSNLSNSHWESASSGASTVYGEQAFCYHNSPTIDACDPEQSLSEYGRLYNWFAVDDPRGLCPSGWHVPTDAEWITMEIALGMSESEANETSFRGTNQGTQMKTDYGWEAGNGTNSTGFSGLPGGNRNVGGDQYDGGDSAYWWSSSPKNGSSSWYRKLVSYPTVSRNWGNQRMGFSVRCLSDSE